MIRQCSRVLTVLWAGSLWALAVWVAPILFYTQPDRHLAGLLAARMFSVETYVGLGAAGLALLLPGRMRFLPGYGAAALLALNEWGLKPVMARAHTHGAVAGLAFGAWHGVSALIYVAACVLVLVFMWNQERGAR